ncbi:hypothetical protein [Paraburkholderia hospita]|uniref:hypothetical protein n=1 Tax=Paraburkholderia hospita TaxID=169430 RepID=UPI003F509B63
MPIPDAPPVINAILFKKRGVLRAATVVSFVIEVVVTHTTPQKRLQEVLRHAGAKVLTT